MSAQYIYYNPLEKNGEIVKGEKSADGTNKAYSFSENGNVEQVYFGSGSTDQ